MNAIKAKKYATIFVSLLLIVGTALTLSAVNAKESNEEWQVNMEEGSTDILGGGDYRWFRFGKENSEGGPMFGIMWGTEDNPNSIAMVTNQNRHVARVMVRDDKGQEMDEERFVKVESFLAAKVGRIWEYNDSNQNGVCDFTVEIGEGISIGSEEVYKYVDLTNASWEASEVEKDQEGDNTTWTFSLTAEELPYHPVEGELSPGMEDKSLDRITFTFHITAGVSEVKRESMPQFDVTLTKGVGNMHRIQNIHRNGTYNFDGEVGSYEMKWDHEIVGWDYDPDNENPALIMGFHNMFGNHIHNMLQWQYRFMHHVREQARARFQDETGEVFSNFSIEQHLRERTLTQNRIEYSGEWSRAGMFKWISDVEVDGEESQMYAQLLGGAPSIHIGPNSRNFAGFHVWGGLNYPGGEHIYHDPGIEGDTYLDIRSSTEEEGFNLPFGGLFIYVLVGIAIIAIIGTIAYTKSLKRNQYDKYDSNQEDDWSDYYDRGRR
ncbi:MAG: hypothetical protein ACOC85_02305 [Thermoplasmatota archaeon]